MALSERIYQTLTNTADREDGDGAHEFARAPKSFVLILLSSLLTKLGDAIASPKTTLAWLASVVGAPPFVLGLLVPVRESGSMIPQLFIGGAIRRLPIRKWVWVSGSVGQGACIVGIGLVAFFLDGLAAGLAMLGLVSAFSLMRAMSSIAAKDVMGKSIPRATRGQLTGWSASIAGFLSIAVGVVLMVPSAANLGGSAIGGLLIFAGLLWLIGAAIYSRIPEREGETGGGRTATESLASLSLLLNDAPFRRFVITRALLMCSALSAPFYVALAQQSLGSPTYLLGAFVAAAGIAGLVSAPLWGRFADRSSKNVMIAAGTLTAGIGIITFFLSRHAPEVGQSAWFLPFAYFVLSVAHSGVRVGRKTYVVNLASGNQRTDYVAVSNSVIGVLLLVVGSIGALVPVVGNAGVIGLLAVMGLAGAVLSTTLHATGATESTGS